MVIDMVTYGAL